MINEDYKIQGWVEDYVDLIEMVDSLPLTYKKDLAERLLEQLETEGYECTWKNPFLTARKVEEL